jgi:hypothetical protein
MSRALHAHAQEWGANGEHEALAAPSTLAAQHALAESRQRRDERSLDKGARPQRLSCLLLLLIFSSAVAGQR